MKEVEYKYTLSNIVGNELNRYQRKGFFGLLTATLIALAFFVIMPKFWQIVWPSMLALRDQQGWANWKFMVVLTTLWHAIWVIIANVVMWAVYHLELPFIEKYKVTS